jgi:hypothetical protein
MIFGCGPAALLGHEHVAGLEIAVQHGLLVRVLHGVADLDEQVDARVAAEPAPVAVGGDRLAADVLHDEVRESRRRVTPPSKIRAIPGWFISASA